MLLDQVTQRAGAGGRGTPAAGGGFDHPPPVGGLVPGGGQGGQGGGQVSGRKRLAGLVGGLGDGQDVHSRLGGDRRVQPWLSAGLPGLAFDGVIGRGKLPAGGAAGVGGFGGRGRFGCGLPRVGEAGAAALDAGGGAGFLLREQGLPGGGCADPGMLGDHRDGRTARLGRQRGQDGRCGTVVRRPGPVRGDRA
ncbi:MAG TPA: hypothetical protein VH594_07720 [Trebonia sp.]